jgi:hypothetical protein
VRFCLRIAVRFPVRFGAKGVKQMNLEYIFLEMCRQMVVIESRWRIGSLSVLYANRTWNRTEICTRIRTRVDGPQRRSRSVWDECSALRT